MRASPFPVPPGTPGFPADPRRAARVLLALALLGLPLPGTAPGAPAARAGGDPAGGPRTIQAAMAGTASELAETLEGTQRERTLQPMGPDGRRDWSYLPGPRTGLAVAGMDARQRRLLHELLRGALGTAGYLKVTGVMSLEEVLRATERHGFVRSSEAYFLAFHGPPGGPGPWGWRLEGHHLSLNFTSASGDGWSATPLFLGSNPAEILAGSRAGTRILAAEEDLARALVRSLDGAQRARAVVSAEAPSDILTRSDPAARRLDPAGLPASEMTASQLALLWRLLEEYVGNLAPALAAAEMERIRGLDPEELAFAWAGGLEPSEGHYYRIQGRTLLIEYDNTQDDANHVHAVWRDLERDFGGDLLREHYMKNDHQRGQGGTHGPSARGFIPSNGHSRIVPVLPQRQPVTGGHHPGRAGGARGATRLPDRSEP